MKNVLNLRLIAALLAAILASFQALQAADNGPTKLTLQSFHCPGCAKKLASKISALPGVAKVDTDLAKASATIIPYQGATLSPRAVWEAAEKVNQKPIKLEGPSGTFTAKPQS